MKILLLSSESDLPETHLFLGIKEKGHEVHVIQKTGSRRTETFRKAGIKVFEHEAKSRISFKSYFFLKNLLQEEKYDLLHHMNARLLTAALFATKGSKTKHIAYRGTVGHLSWFDPASLLSYLHPRVSAISCVSNAVKNYLLNLGVASEKLFTIYKGHDLKWYRPLQNPASRSNFYLPVNTFVISCIANIRPVKGVDILIQAFSLLPEEINAYLFLIGEVKDKDSLLNMLTQKQRERVILTGFLPEAHQYIKLSDCFVMPSREREGLPKALIEAMISGVPSIGSNVGGIPEIIEDSVSGILVEPGNAEILSKMLLEIFHMGTEDRKNLGLKGQERILSGFKIENTINETLLMYQKILS